MKHLPIFFRVASQAVVQSRDCPIASELTFLVYGWNQLVPNHNKTKQSANHAHYILGCTGIDVSFAVFKILNWYT